MLFTLTMFSMTEAVEMNKQKKAPVKIVQMAGRDILGKIAPEFARLNDDVLFGIEWSRNDILSLRDRSLVTVATLVAKGMGGDSAFVYHMTEAKKNGIIRDEMAEILTHEAFYAGWPNAWAAFNTMKQVYGEAKIPEDESAMTEAEFEAVNVFGKGQPNDAYAKYFSGKSYLNVLSKPGDPLGIFNVTFEPGCRNNWHIHHAKTGGGQVLIVTAGRGWYHPQLPGAGSGGHLLFPHHRPPPGKSRTGAGANCRRQPVEQRGSLWLRRTRARHDRRHGHTDAPESDDP